MFLCGCSGAWHFAPEFTYVPVDTGTYEIATYQKITDVKSDMHIYIEGDGYAFDAYGRPTSDPTPRGTLVRDMAMRDTAANVVYIARPCQFIMSPACQESDWTDGRFSEQIIDSIASVVRSVSNGRRIVLIGYSGGAMISGLVITRNPKLRVKKWVTIGGVLDHVAWTNHFGDRPLTKSLNLKEMPHVPAIHYVGEHDNIVPPELIRAAVGNSGKIVVIPNAGHSDLMPDLNEIK